ncbi:MAG: lactate racemase domain-containing protein [Gemmatimonadota bacterium]|nr:lactate racemase domain-containing protein [Gemmatimonadota bacterium]
MQQSDQVTGYGYADGRTMSAEQARELCAEGFDRLGLEGKRVLVIIPDSTRTVPLDVMFPIFYDLLKGRGGGRGQVKNLHYLVALGTHPPMSEEKIAERVGQTPESLERDFPGVKIYNHRWDLPDTFAEIGEITAEEIEEISGGLFSESVKVPVNRMIFDYDQLIILGPTFPHEVVGFSGGNKYFFPGISGDELVHFFHWLGAVITNPLVNGNKWTPTRRVVDKAAEMITVPTANFDMVEKGGQLAGLFIGPAREAWSRAADLSAKLHIRQVDRKYKSVLGVAPRMYDDIWTAGKVMYKLEPVIEDGGELIIYAPHIDEVSYTHGRVLDRIGYHTRDYFLAQMEKFEGVPRGIMAHSTHVKGGGTYTGGIEKPRINVVLATAIPEERCRMINLGYRDPATIKLDEWKAREHEGVLFVPKAGETLYRLAGENYEA